MEWISVDKELPNFDEEVLFYANTSSLKGYTVGFARIISKTETAEGTKINWHLMEIGIKAKENPIDN